MRLAKNACRPAEVSARRPPRRTATFRATADRRRPFSADSRGRPWPRPLRSAASRPTRRACPCAARANVPSADQRHARSPPADPQRAVARAAGNDPAAALAAESPARCDKDQTLPAWLFPRERPPETKDHLTAVPPVRVNWDQLAANSGRGHGAVYYRPGGRGKPWPRVCPGRGCRRPARGCLRGRRRPWPVGPRPRPGRHGSGCGRP
jgi:hypothetical protein